MHGAFIRRDGFCAPGTNGQETNRVVIEFVLAVQNHDRSGAYHRQIQCLLIYFTVRGQRYRGSTGKTKAVRATTVACMKLAQTLKHGHPFRKKARLFTRQHLDSTTQTHNPVVLIRRIYSLSSIPPHSRMLHNSTSTVGLLKEGPQWRKGINAVGRRRNAMHTEKSGSCSSARVESLMVIESRTRFRSINQRPSRQGECVGRDQKTASPDNPSGSKAGRNT